MKAPEWEKDDDLLYQDLPNGPMDSDVSIYSPTIPTLFGRTVIPDTYIVQGKKSSERLRFNGELKEVLR